MTRARKRRSCKLCKSYKFMGNNPERKPIRDRRKLQPDRRKG